MNIAEHGFQMVRGVFGAREIAAMLTAIETLDGAGVRSRGGVYAVRNLLEASEEIALIASSPLALGIVGAGMFPVRATLFDKTPGANWLVPWHQDLTICVRERKEVLGYGPWTLKAGVWHVQPPARILERVLSMRIHLDACDESNGALQVLPGTHRLARLDAAGIDEQKRKAAAVCCAAAVGDVLLMRPLLLHASSASDHPAHRRVIHIDYASGTLDAGLEWPVVSSSPAPS